MIRLVLTIWASRSFAALCVLTAIVVPSAAEATPILEIVFSKSQGSGCLNASTSSDTGPITLAENCSFAQVGAPVSTASASSRANFGQVGTDLEMTISPEGRFTPRNANGTIARAVSDYIFSGPELVVAFAINLDVEGFFESVCPGHCQIYSRITSAGLDQEFKLQDVTGSLDVNDTLTGNLVVVPTNIPVPIFLKLEVGGGLLSNGSGQFLSVSGLFHNTVTFHEGGPVFTLPAGFTVNGPCVTDNRFVCGAEPVPVPEPATIALLSFGTVGMLAVRRRRAS